MNNASLIGARLELNVENCFCQTCITVFKSQSHLLLELSNIHFEQKCYSCRDLQKEF